MAKCYNCGKIFDYEKYYGICPKCSAYNQENLPEAQHEKLHKEYDEGNCQNKEYDEDNYQENLHKEWKDDNYQEKLDKEYEEGNYQKEPLDFEKKVSSGPSVLVFIILLIGILAGIAAPVGYGTYCIMRMAKRDVDTVHSYEQNTKKIPQEPEVVTRESGESFTLGEDTQCQIQVEQAYIVAKGNEVNGFPKGENLIAVKLGYETGNMKVYGSYDFTGEPYIKYDDQFRICMTEYSLMDYEQIISDVNMLDVWDIRTDVNGTGVFLFFVPAEITSIHFYMDSRNENTNDISAVYEVPLEINAGEGI